MLITTQSVYRRRKVYISLMVIVLLITMCNYRWDDYYNIVLLPADKMKPKFPKKEDERVKVQFD